MCPVSSVVGLGDGCRGPKPVPTHLLPPVPVEVAGCPTGRRPSTQHVCTSPSHLHTRRAGQPSSGCDLETPGDPRSIWLVTAHLLNLGLRCEVWMGPVCTTCTVVMAWLIVCVCACVQVYVCAHVYIYIYAHVWRHRYMRMCVYMCTCVCEGCVEINRCM